MTVAAELDRQDWFTAAMSREPAPVPAPDPDPAGSPPPDAGREPAAGVEPATPDMVAESCCGTDDSLASTAAGGRPGSRWLGEDRGARRVALGLGAGLVVAVAAIVATVVSFSADPAAPAARHAAVAPPAVAPVRPAAAPPVTPPAAQQDQAIPFTAAAACPAGSSSAQSLADAATPTPWVCVRGPQGGQVDGQVLHVDFGASYLVSAVAVTPGWVPGSQGGRDEWLQHRVVSRLQYVFNDADRTVFVQQTGNVHGPVTAPLPRTVLASQATVVVLQTARPPASPLPPPADPPGTRPGFGDSVLGPGGFPLPGDAALSVDPIPADGVSDPVDATFAVSALKFFGHTPN